MKVSRICLGWGEDNIKMHYNEIADEDSDWIFLAPDGSYWKAATNTALKFLIP
jgi:hypothetical protein